MSTLMEECVGHPKIMASVKTFAAKLSHYLPASMNFEDARQELLTGLLERLSRFDSSRSSLPTYAFYVLMSLSNNIIRSRCYRSYELTMPLEDEILEKLVDYHMESRVVDKMLCDQIEGELNGIARSVFSILRTGIPNASCAAMLGIHRSYISHLLERKIRKVVNECNL